MRRVIDHEDMPPEIDMSKAVRGVHYAGPNAVLHFPPEVQVRLHDDSISFLAKKAERKGVPLEELIASIVEKEVALLRELE